MTDEIKNRTESTIEPLKTEPPMVMPILRGGQVLRAPVNVATPTTVAELVTVLRTLGLLK